MCHARTKNDCIVYWPQIPGMWTQSNDAEFEDPGEQLPL